MKDRERTLSIHRKGIVDFGDCGRTYSPIDLYAEAHGVDADQSFVELSELKNDEPVFLKPKQTVAAEPAAAMERTVDAKPHLAVILSIQDWKKSHLDPTAEEIKLERDHWIWLWSNTKLFGAEANEAAIARAKAMPDDFVAMVIRNTRRHNDQNREAFDRAFARLEGKTATILQFPTVQADVAPLPARCEPGWRSVGFWQGFAGF